MHCLPVGGLNTPIRYLLGLGLHCMLSPRLHVLLTGAAPNVRAISFSFRAYKMPALRTRGRLLAECLRSCFVYGGLALISTILLWMPVYALRPPSWLAQVPAIGLTALVSRLGSSRYTFRPAQDARSR